MATSLTDARSSDSSSAFAAFAAVGVRHAPSAAAAAHGPSRPDWVAEAWHLRCIIISQ